MGSLITFGEYNKLYKFIWFYLINKLIFEYLFGTDFPEEIKIFKKDTFPKNRLVQEAINYLGLIIFSIILYIYETEQSKGETPRISLQSDPRISLKSESDSAISSSKKNKKTELIYKNYEKNKTPYKPGFKAIILFILCDQLINIFFGINLKGLDFRMFEILFVCYFTLVIFGIPIYKHKQLSIIFILIFCTLMKILSIIYRLIDSHKIRIFKVYIWIIPIGILSYVLTLFIRAYTFCKIKWLLDFKFISNSKLLIYYGVLGSLLCSIISIIPSNFSCLDKNTFNYIEYFCNVTDYDRANNRTTYYYENYSIYLRNLWREDRDILINIVYIILLILRIIFSFFIKLFSNSIYYFIIESIDSLACLFLKKFKYYKLFDILDELFSIAGTIFYLELIEFKFCNFDYNLKQNIKKRCISDSNLDSSYDEENNENDDSNNTSD